MKGRINYLRLILAAGLAIVLIGGSFALLYLLFAQKDDGLTYEKVNIQAGNDYVVSGGYLTYATNTGLIQYQLESSRVTQTKLSSPVDGFDVSASMTAVYAGSAFQLKNYDVLNLSGTIRSVSGADPAGDASLMTCTVTIAVPNAGSLTTAQAAVAQVNGVSSLNSAHFTYQREETIAATASGTVSELCVKEGSTVRQDDVIGWWPQSDQPARRRLRRLQRS